ncbi:uncharacterized protein LOC129613969 [Condylostylus longicornis]|uniref:uncharacterized protein LOC129613969 n=1 Tax=Condylostylus longicornis TaxID=2530218 RepID=UPI00244DBBAA|nr:uncharacterized protein LOC129613969 [Condylostylus longicornis]XP_055384298.1 uncharacterized protein LOC129613969 [Condylostylus longicornis]
MNEIYQWGKIPTLALENIFSYLDRKSVLTASSTCLHWRSVVFQKKFFTNFKFRLQIDDDKQCQFFLHCLVNLVSELTIVFDFLNVYHIDKIRRVLYRIVKCDQLRGIRFETNSVGLPVPGEKYQDEDLVDVEKIFVEPLKMLLSRRRSSIKIFDLGAIECLTYYAADFLKLLAKPQDLEEITFASIKFNPSSSSMLALEHMFFEKCTSLQILSLDYDSVTDELLKTIQILPLKKLLICIHEVDRAHPGISETAWAEFASKFNKIDLILTLIYAYEAVELLQLSILKRSMPVTHLRVLFCNFMNVDALDVMSMYYQTTLKSVQWVDSAYQETDRNVMDLYMRSGQDPFVMMSWRCKNLEEIVIHGYVLDPHNLVGISRLCGKKLKKLEVSMLDSAPNANMMDSFIEEISSQLGQKWRPLNSSNIHPALGFIHPTHTADDIQNEYILDIIRRDLSN